jgi:predicted RNase H-like nuclease (RuvC/YqgF family)
MHIISKILNKSKSSEDEIEVPENEIGFPGSIQAQNEKERKLLIKIDELEADNQSLINKFQELSDEKENLYQKFLLVNEELAKKSEEVKNTRIGVADTDDFETTITIKDNKINELNEYISQLKKNNSIQIANLQVMVNRNNKYIYIHIYINDCKEGIIRYY